MTIRKYGTKPKKSKRAHFYVPKKNGSKVARQRSGGSTTLTVPKNFSSRKMKILPKVNLSTDLSPKDDTHLSLPDTGNSNIKAPELSFSDFIKLDLMALTRNI